MDTDRNPDTTMTDVTHPIEGQIVLLAGAKASVPLTRLSELLERTQCHLEPRRGELARQYEHIDADGVEYYLAEVGYWEDVGGQLGFTDRETDAVRRTHEEQFRRDGRRLDRREEFETALDIREIVATPPSSRSSR